MTIVRDKKNKVSIPRDLLFQCPRCGSSMFMDDFVGASKVCTSCGYHARLTAQERLDLTIDKGTFEEYDADMTSKNPIQFDGYEKKIADLQKKTGLRDAILTGECPDSQQALRDCGDGLPLYDGVHGKRGRRKADARV